MRLKKCRSGFNRFPEQLGESITTLRLCNKAVKTASTGWKYKITEKAVEATATVNILIYSMLEPGKDFDFFNPYEKVATSRSNLPHWRQDRTLYFVTFRQADSIPKEKLLLWKSEYEQWLNRNEKPWSEAQATEYQEHFARRIEQWLDSKHGSCLLQNKACIEIVTAQLKANDGTNYLLDTFTIAPNHVHALVVPLEGNALSGILKAWKGASAFTINRFLKRTGPLWQKESYDHIVRNAEALDRIRRYILSHDKSSKRF